MSVVDEPRNIINNYESPADRGWKVKAGLWLAITGAAGNLFAGILTELLKSYLVGEKPK